MYLVYQIKGEDNNGASVPANILLSCVPLVENLLQAVCWWDFFLPSLVYVPVQSVSSEAKGFIYLLKTVTS